MSWDEFDNLVEQETSSLNSQINKAQNAIDRYDYIRLLFAGGPAKRGDQSVRTLTGAVSDLLSDINAAESRSRDDQLSLEKLLAASNGVALDYTLPNGNKLLRILRKQLQNLHLQVLAPVKENDLLILDSLIVLSRCGLRLNKQMLLLNVL